MKKIIINIIVFGCLSAFSSGSQDIEVGIPFTELDMVYFEGLPNSITNHSCSVSGTSINVEIFTTSTKTTWKVTTFDTVPVGFPALPEGNYTVHVSIVGNGYINPVTKKTSGDYYLSVPSMRLISEIPSDPLYFHKGDLQIVDVNYDGNFMEYRLLEPASGLTLETTTNLTSSSWRPIGHSATTNFIGCGFRERSFNIPMTNSQEYIRVIQDSP